jgi:transposase
MGKINNQQLKKMKAENLTNKVIAKRLGISEKTVQRACSDLHIKVRGRFDRTTEEFQRDAYLALGESGGNVAERFGISRQAVLK